MKRTELLLTIALVMIVIIAARLMLPHDSTDNPDGGRSGLILYTDHLTGCQYLRAGWFSPLVPRMYQDTHVCKEVREYLERQQ